MGGVRQATSPLGTRLQSGWGCKSLLPHSPREKRMPSPASSLLAGVQFLTDAKGRKVAVQIDLRKHGALWQDFYDGLVSEQRRKERGVPFEAVKADLTRRGRLRA